MSNTQRAQPRMQRSVLALAQQEAAWPEGLQIGKSKVIPCLKENHEILLVFLDP